MQQPRLDLAGLALMWLLGIDDCRDVDAVVDKFVGHVSHVVNVEVRRLMSSIHVRFEVRPDQYFGNCMRNFEEDVAACVGRCGPECVDKCRREVEQQCRRYVKTAAEMTLVNTVSQFMSLLSACGIRYVGHIGTTALVIVFRR